MPYSQEQIPSTPSPLDPLCRPRDRASGRQPTSADPSHCRPSHAMKRKTVIDTAASGVTLKLDKTPDFLDRLQQSLSKGKDDDKYQRVRECKVIGKMKSRSYSALKVKVGLWQKSADNENDIVVKFYFNQRRFLWEILHEQRKLKMEVSLNHVSAFRAAFNEETTFLFIQLEKLPAFLKEDDQVPQKQTTWSTIPDFTHGQAQKHRWHGLTFRKEVFGKSQYEEIIYSKPNLYLKSCSRFSSTNSLYFEGVPNDVGGSLLEVLDQLNPHCLPNQTQGNSASEVQQQAVVVPDPLHQIPRANANSHRSSLVASINSSVQYMQPYASMNPVPTNSAASNFQPNYSSINPMRDNRDPISPILFSQIVEQPAVARSTRVPNLYNSQMHNIDPHASNFQPNYASAEASSFFYGENPNGDGILPMVSQIVEQPSWAPSTQFHGRNGSFLISEMNQVQGGVQNSSVANGSLCNPTEEEMHGPTGSRNREITLDADEYGALEEPRSLMNCSRANDGGPNRQLLDHSLDMFF